MNIEMRPDGFVLLDDLLVLPRFSSYSVQDVTDVVQHNDKKRFELTQHETSAALMIRASQGHTLSIVNSEELLERIQDPSQIPICIHGTYKRFWNSIRVQGLWRKQRNHIHFACAEVGTEQLISGMRSSAQLKIYIDVQAAMNDGIVFYWSANNVVLSPGVGENGIIHPQYFSRVVDVSDGSVIFPPIAERQLGQKP